eukprot:5461585-Alexandrium_andersonii.AAC.1
MRRAGAPAQGCRERTDMTRGSGQRLTVPCTVCDYRAAALRKRACIGVSVCCPGQQLFKDWLCTARPT